MCSVQMLNTIYAGKSNDVYLNAGVGMGNMLMNVVSFSIYFGVNGAMETLVSQSYGQQNYKMCGIYLNNGRVICTLLMIPMSLFFVYTDHILTAMDQDLDVTAIANKFVIQVIPGCWALG